MATASSLAEVAQGLAAEAVRFASFGWMRGTSGNLSAVVRDDPLLLAVTVSGVDKSTLTAADVSVVDGQGVPVSGYTASASVRPSAEAALHARVVRLTGARAVMHFHTIAAVLAARWWPAGVHLADLEMLKGISLPAAGETVLLPVIANSQDMTELGDRFEQAWNSRVPGIVVANHGLYAWGDSMLKARHHAEVIEWVLEFMTAAERR